MNSILIKALMKHYNEFFTMSTEEQDVWRLQEHDEIDEKIRDHVSNELGFDDDSHDIEKQYEYNVIMLDYYGVGPNKFMMNELGWSIKNANSESLYTYNEYYHNFQEKSWQENENFPNHEPEELYNRYANWARAEVNGKFHYLNLDSLQIWIQWRLDDISYDWMEKNLPHDYVEGKDNHKKVDGGFLWDMKLDAHGLEGWYEQMRDFGYEWTNTKFKENNELGDVVFIVDKTEKIYDPSLDYVFGSLNVLKTLTFNNFVQEAEKVKGDNEILFAYSDKVCAEFTDALNAKFEEVKKTSPNVIKLKKKKNIVMTDGALDDLMRLDDEL